MTITITSEAGDAIRDLLLDRLNGVSDIAVATEGKEFDAAERMVGEYLDELRLLRDDIGVRNGDGQPVKLNSPPDVLRRVLPRICTVAKDHTTGLEPEWVEVRDLKDRNRLISETCASVLIELGAQGTGD